MRTTIGALVRKFVAENENWYIDPYPSYTEVGIENLQNFGGFIAALEDRDIDYEIIQAGSEGGNMVYVYD